MTVVPRLVASEARAPNGSSWADALGTDMTGGAPLWGGSGDSRRSRANHTAHKFIR